MQSVVKKVPTKRGILRALMNFEKQALSVERLSKMQSELRNTNTRIGFSNCIAAMAIPQK